MIFFIEVREKNIRIVEVKINEFLENKVCENY